MNANIKRLLQNGAIGLAVMIVVGLVPMVNALASVVGGAVAGYLQKEDVRGGAIAGAVTGLLWTAATVLLLVVAVVGFGITSAPGVGLFDWLPAAGGAAWIVLLFVVGNGVVVLTTTVGGVVGSLLARETETASRPEQPQY
jgi:hypothetical protein